MTSMDEAVLEFIGLYGQWQYAIEARFPDFDLMRLVRAHLVAVVFVEGAETEAHAHRPHHLRYVLTDRGAEAVGIPTD